MWCNLEIGEPIHGETPPPPLGMVKWQACRNLGWIRTSSFDTTLSIYQGQSIEDLLIVGQNDDYLKTSTSEVEVEVSAGTTYAIAVDGFGSQIP